MFIKARQLVFGFISAAVLLACQPEASTQNTTENQSLTEQTRSTPQVQSSAAHLLGHAVQVKSPQQIVSSRPDVFEIFRIPSAPQVLILDFSDLRQQGDMLNRLAAFHELAGFSRQEILSDQAIKAQLNQEQREWESVYYGHDYSAQELAAFFNQIQAQALPLSSSEQFLLQLLLREGLIKKGDQDYQASEPAQSLISLSEDKDWRSQQKSDQIRLFLLAHEIRHGLYDTNSAYRKACHDFWNGLAYSQQAAFRESLALMHYDPSQEDLMINETQAYLLSNTQSLESIRLSLQELLQIKKQLLLSLPPESLSLAVELED